MSLGWSDNSNIYSNITGSVQTQLEHRKDIVFKKTGRTDSDIQFLNTNTGWVKLSSGVKEIVKDSKLKGIKIGSGLKSFFTSLISSLDCAKQIFIFFLLYRK